MFFSRNRLSTGGISITRQNIDLHRTDFDISTIMIKRTGNPKINNTYAQLLAEFKNKADAHQKEWDDWKSSLKREKKALQAQQAAFLADVEGEIVERHVAPTSRIVENDMVIAIMEGKPVPRPSSPLAHPSSPPPPHPSSPVAASSSPVRVSGAELGRNRTLRLDAIKRTVGELEKELVGTPRFVELSTDYTELSSAYIRDYIPFEAEKVVPVDPIPPLLQKIHQAGVKAKLLVPRAKPAFKGISASQLALFNELVAHKTKALEKLLERKQKQALRRATEKERKRQQALQLQKTEYVDGNGAGSSRAIVMHSLDAANLPSTAADMPIDELPSTAVELPFAALAFLANVADGALPVHHAASNAQLPVAQVAVAFDQEPAQQVAEDRAMAWSLYAERLAEIRPPRSTRGKRPAEFELDEQAGSAKRYNYK